MFSCYLSEDWGTPPYETPFNRLKLKISDIKTGCMGLMGLYKTFKDYMGLKEPIKDHTRNIQNYAGLYWTLQDIIQG